MQVKEYTMADYITAINNETITMKSLHYQEIDEVSGEFLITNGDSILRLYREDLKNDSVLVILDNDQKRKYHYKPWLFCLDTYGISDLWFELLDLNQIRSFSQFDHEKIRAFAPGFIGKLKTVIKLEEDVVNERSSKLTQDIKEATLA